MMIIQANLKKYILIMKILSYNENWMLLIHQAW